MPRTGGPFLLFLAMLLAGCAGTPARSGPDIRAAASSHDCVPFARALTGIDLAGDADAWWQQAEGRYVHARTPEIGSVLVFRPTGRLPHGHVAVVSGVQSRRQILVTHANWAPGRVGTDQPAVDLSPDNDWTEVRVWWEPSGTMGLTAYPTYGFIALGRTVSHDALLAQASQAAIEAEGR
jgi:hypothetical protein